MFWGCNASVAKIFLRPPAAGEQKSRFLRPSVRCRGPEGGSRDHVDRRCHLETMVGLSSALCVCVCRELRRAQLKPPVHSRRHRCASHPTSILEGILEAAAGAGVSERALEAVSAVACSPSKAVAAPKRAPVPATTQPEHAECCGCGRIISCRE